MQFRELTMMVSLNRGFKFLSVDERSIVSRMMNINFFTDRGNRPRTIRLTGFSVPKGKESIVVRANAYK